MLKARWAYDFACEQPMEVILDTFNAVGPWRWELRERLWYGDYLSCRPEGGVRLRVHEYPGGYGVIPGLREKGYKASLDIETESLVTRSAVDDSFRRLLQAINATHVIEIEPYD